MLSYARKAVGGLPYPYGMHFSLSLLFKKIEKVNKIEDNIH